MKRWLALTCAAGLSLSAAYAQQVMDGSDRNIDRSLVQKAFRSLTKFDKEPYSAQIDRLFTSETNKHAVSLCGFVNRQDASGDYRGFQPFAYNSSSDTSFIFDKSEPIPSVIEFFRRNIAMTGCESILPPP